eukprot:XP_001694827.1 predicted protein [Chlamydomonas reinhardtii]
MASLLTDAIASLGRWQAFRSYDGESSAHEWLEDLEETMDKMGYRQSSFVERASEKLQGEAKSWYRWWREYDQPGPLSWEDFKATFLDEFGLSTSDWEERLVTCQQCLQEPTQAYSNRFTTYARRANRMKDPSLVTLYVRGLKKSLSEALDLFGRRTPTSTLKEMSRLSLNMRDRVDGGGARGRGRYGGELNMVWRDYEGSEGSLYPDSDSEYDDALEGELLASEQKRFRDFDLGQRLPRSPSGLIAARSSGTRQPPSPPAAAQPLPG